MINNGKTNEMPAQEDKLTDAQIHVLAAYVWGLSNKPAPPNLDPRSACGASPRGRHQRPGGAGSAAALEKGTGAGSMAIGVRFQFPATAGSWNLTPFFLS